MTLPMVMSTLFTCCLREMAMEKLLELDRGSGNVATFISFLVIALEGFVNTTRCGSRKPLVPISSWLTLVTMHFVVSVMNNAALTFYVAMPLHMIFRSGSLLASLLLNMFWLGRQYSRSKCFSVGLITLGIGLCTFMSARVLSEDKVISNNASLNNLLWWTLGVAMLSIALFISAAMGIVQENIAIKYGKHPKEALFYTHFLPLPAFLFLYTDLRSHLEHLMNSQPLLLTWSLLPSGMFWLFIYSLSQYMCIASVFQLTTELSSLNVTLVVTLRKFISLLFSIFHFGNNFTQIHYLGASLVFVGTLIYSDVPNKLIVITKHSKRD